MWDLIVSVPDHCLSFYFALHSNLWWDFFSAVAESWKILKDTTAFSSFLVCYNRS